MGCSTHSVPSWSKVAIRAAGGTNLGAGRVGGGFYEIKDGLLGRTVIPGGQGVLGLGQRHRVNSAPAPKRPITASLLKIFFPRIIKASG
jgi:hypothetical protein